MLRYRPLLTFVQVLNTKMVYPLHLKRGASRAISNKPHENDVIGIDFGTTYARVAVMEGKVPTVIDTVSGQATPCLVAVNGEKDILVGEAAKLHAFMYSTDLLFKMKNLIGRRYDEQQTQQLKSMVPYKIFSGPDGAALVEASNNHFSATDVCAFILDEAKKSAEAYLKRSISKAVIAVPSDFSDTQTNNMKLAAKSVGLDVIGIIEEPKAAILSSTSMRGGVFVVLDMGGGTFDVSICERFHGGIKVIAQYGDGLFGGDDFDNALLEHFLEEIKRAYSFDVSSDRIAMMRLKEAAEKAKVELSYFSETLVCGYFGTTRGPRHLMIRVSRAKFEEVVDHLIEKVRSLCEKCLKEAEILVEKVDEVILVGGMARVPRVQQIVQEVFGKSPNTEVNPEEAVVLGASIQGNLILEGQKKVPPDAIPLSIGIETLGGNFTKIINRNSEIPVKGSRFFSTECDNQESVCFTILLGEREMASGNIFLGELKVTDIPPAPQGVPCIELAFNIDKNCILLASAKHNGREQVTQIKLSVLDEKLVRRKVEEEILYGPRNKKQSMLARLRCMATIVIGQLERALLLKEKEIPEDNEDHSGALSALNDLKSAMDSVDPHTIKEKIIVAKECGRLLFMGRDDEYVMEDDDEYVMTNCDDEYIW